MNLVIVSCIVDKEIVKSEFSINITWGILITSLVEEINVEAYFDYA